MTEAQRRAILESVRGTLAAEDIHLTPEDDDVLLAYMRGDITHEEILAPLSRGHG